MPTEKNNISLRILVAPLDWGLGHATRCIPLVHTLLHQGHQVRLGGSGASGKILAAEFPDLPFDEIPSHEIQYASTKRRFGSAMLCQLPKLFRQIRQERLWLREYLQRYPIDVVLSDNRYGLHHPSTYNVLITHQLEPRSGIAKWADRILHVLGDQVLKHFNVCWVPDHADYPTLSGALGHPKRKLPIPIRYIGPLTRFHVADCPIEEKKICIVISGPEPQRTLLEQKCIRELAQWDGTIILTRGLPTGSTHLTLPVNWQAFDHLPTKQLQQEIASSEWVVARSGYSTLMDLSALKKKAILIPTPGQPEQEYLADWIGSQGLARCIDQEEDLLIALTEQPERIDPFQLQKDHINTEDPLIASLQLIRSLQP